MESPNPYSDPPILAATVVNNRSEPGPPQAIETLIPFRNAPALIAYYLGLFSWFPVLGLPLAIAALILGVMGLRKRSRQPQLKGAVHACVGIVMGFISLLINLLIVSVIIFGFSSGAWNN